MGESVLFKDADVMTMSEAGIIRDGDVLVRNGMVAEVSREIRIEDHPDAKVVDARNRILMPGFVDTHRHVWQTQMRGLATDWSLFDYVVNMRLRYGACYDPDDAYLGNYVGALEALNAGITTVVDHSHITISPEHSELALGALRDAGIRGMWCFGAFRNPDYDAHSNARDALIEGFSPVSSAVLENARHMSGTAFRGEDDLLRFGWAANELEFFSPDNIAAELAFARDLGSSVISMHAGMGAFLKDVRLIPILSDLGALGSDMLLVHGGNFTDEELGILAAGLAAISTTPETEMQMAMGHPVAARFGSLGGKASLGIDIASNYAGDMFAQMRLMLQAERRERNRIQENAGLNPGRLSYFAPDVVNLATREGARAIGLGDKVGRIEAGMEADLILLRTDAMNMAPMNDHYGAVALYANIGDVDSVMVKGRFVKRHGRLLNVDWDALRDRICASRDRILGRAANIPCGPAEEFLAGYWHFPEGSRQPGQ